MRINEKSNILRVSANVLTVFLSVTQKVGRKG